MEEQLLEVYTSGLNHACAHIKKHDMKYSLHLPPNTGFSFAEDKAPRRPPPVKVNTSNAERLSDGTGRETEGCNTDRLWMGNSWEGQEGVCVLNGDACWLDGYTS